MNSFARLTALFGVFIRVIAAVVLAVALPGQRLAQSVVTLELVVGAETLYCERERERERARVTGCT